MLKSKKVKVLLSSMLVVSVFACTAPTIAKKVTTEDADISNVDRAITSKVTTVTSDNVREIRVLISQGKKLSEIKKILEEDKRTFTAQELIRAGFTVKDFIETYIDDFNGKPRWMSAIKASGFTARDFKVEGFSATKAKEAGYSSVDLKKGGYSLKEIFDAGFTNENLISDGFPSNFVGYFNKPLPGGLFFSVAGNIRIALSGSQIANLITKDDLTHVGHSGDWFKFTNVPAQNPLFFNNSIKTLKSEGKFTVRDLKVSGYTEKDLLEMLKEGYTPKELKEGGFDIYDFMKGRLTIKVAKQAGFNVIDSKRAGYAFKDILDAGYTKDDLKDSGYISIDFKSAGYTVTNLKEIKYTLGELLKAGFTPDEIEKTDKKDIFFESTDKSIPSLSSNLVKELIKEKYNSDYSGKYYIDSVTSLKILKESSGESYPYKFNVLFEYTYKGSSSGSDKKFVVFEYNYNKKPFKPTLNYNPSSQPFWNTPIMGKYNEALWK